MTKKAPNPLVSYLADLFNRRFYVQGDPKKRLKRDAERHAMRGRVKGDPGTQVINRSAVQDHVDAVIRRNKAWNAKHPAHEHRTTSAHKIRKAYMREMKQRERGSVSRAT